MILDSQLRMLPFAFMVFVGGGSIGLVAMAQRGQEIQGPAAPAPAASPPVTAKSEKSTRPDAPTDKPKWRALAEGRIETARQILDQQTRLAKNGELGFEQIPPWSLRLMESQMRSAATAAGRLSAIREHLGRRKDIELYLERSLRLGQIAPSTVLEGKYFRLEAEQLLAEEEGGVNKRASKGERPGR